MNYINQAFRRLGKALKQRHGRSVYVKRIDDDDEKPYLTFNLKYRSLSKHSTQCRPQQVITDHPEALQSMLIIPRSPLLTPQPTRQIASLSTEELVASLSKQDIDWLLERRAVSRSRCS